MARAMKVQTPEQSFEKAHQLLVNHNYEGALKVLEAALRVDSLDITALSGKAEALLGLKRYDEAIDTLHRIVRLNPGSVLAWTAMGDIYDTQGKLSEALRVYGIAVKLHPDAELFQKMGHLYEKTGDGEKAKECFARAKEFREDKSAAIRRFLDAEKPGKRATASA